MIFASGLSVPEAPVSLPEGGWLVVEMGREQGSVTQLGPGGERERVVARTGRPNGLALDRDGNIWVAETLSPALLRLTSEGQVEVFATECDGEPFLFPNDLAFGPDGALYMTDSGILLQDLMPHGYIRLDFAYQRYDGRVYRIDVRSRAVRRLDEGLEFANGVAFGPDGRLYVTETLSGMVYAYEMRDAEAGPRLSFASVSQPSEPAAFHGPDGCKFGADGNLYVAVFGQGHVAVVGPDGEVVRRIETLGREPTNLAFGSRGEERIYVTEDELGTLEAIDVGSEGLPLFRGERVSRAPTVG